MRFFLALLCLVGSVRAETYQDPKAAAFYAEHPDFFRFAKPADLPKDSGRFDLPIAIGILAASGQVDASRLSGHEFAGDVVAVGVAEFPDGGRGADV